MMPKGTKDLSSNSDRLKHDALFKTIMQDKLAAREFLEYYLPVDFKELIDLSQISIEKESFVEEELKRRLSDILYKIKTKDNEEAFVYVLIEAEVEPKYWISLKLWKYMLLLCERHMKSRNKLPLIAPLVFYHGNKPFKVPKNLWDLFTMPCQAKKLMTEDFKLIDLHSMPDDEIMKKQHLGMLEYFMKHIKDRDTLKLWRDFLEKFEDAILIDRENGYVYIKSFLWYTDARVAEEEQEELSRIIQNGLPAREGEEIMGSIAQKYIEEGRQEGIEKGIEKTALNMLRAGSDITFIASVTGLSRMQLQKLKASL